MYTDIVIPNNNEQQFITIAEQLGINAIMFLYQKPKDLSSLQKNTKIKLISGKLNELGTGERKNIDDKQKKYLYGFETLERKDSLHQKRSGLNQALAKIMKQKEKIYIISFEQILENKEPHIIIGRLIQNLEIIHKQKLDVAIASMATKPENLRNPKDYEAFIRALGYQEEAKKATRTLLQQINNQ